MAKTYRKKEDILTLPWILIRVGKIPKCAAVYRLVNKFTGEEEYIGETVNLYRRLMPSHHPIYKQGIHHVLAHFTATDIERHYLEYRSIALLKPSMNNRAGKVDITPSIADTGYKEIFD